MTTIIERMEHGTELLHEYRDALQELREALLTLIKHRVDPSAVRDKIELLEARVIHIEMPCVTGCGNAVILSYPVDSGREPDETTAVFCDECGRGVW